MDLESLYQLVKRCTNLVDFGMPDTFNAAMEQFLEVLTPQVTALDLSALIICKDAARILCERFKSLQYLCMLYPDFGADHYCIPQIVDSLPNLQCLCVQRLEPPSEKSTQLQVLNEFYFTEADVLAWKLQ
jgi:hypothetical protein